MLSKDIKNWVFNSKKHFDIYLFSNNPSKKRIKLIADQLDLKFTHSGGKPSKKKLNELIDKIPYSMSEIAIIIITAIFTHFFAITCFLRKRLVDVNFEK